MTTFQQYITENPDTLVIFYGGGIDYSGYDSLTKYLEKIDTDKYKKCLFMLVTFGGNPDYGYRISRALGHYFPDGFDIYVPSVCKSAGTLIAIGAKSLIISDRGELGPLDIQLNNPNELFEQTSGLDFTTAIEVVTNRCMVAFRDNLIELKGAAKLSTRLSAEIASDMATKLVNPILSQIDPSQLGGRQRAVNIGIRYGCELRKKFENITEGNCIKLVLDYPSHSYVIDRKEARTLFDRVEAPKNDKCIEELIRAFIPEGLRSILQQNMAPVIIKHDDLIAFDIELEKSRTQNTTTNTKNDESQTEVPKRKRARKSNTKKNRN